MESETTKFETTDIKKPKFKRRWMGMGWKSLLTVFVILGIGAMLLSTESGQKFAAEALDALKIKAGNFVSGLFSGASKWDILFGQQQIPSGEQFLISLSIEKSSFYEQQYSLSDVSNTSLDATGICENAIEIDDVVLHKEAASCNIAADSMKGVFEYTVAGTVKFNGYVSSLNVDGHTYTPADSRLKISFEMLPSDFTLNGLLQKKITITSATGSIERLNPDGSIKSTEELEGEELEINGFVGFIKLENSNIKLQGLAVSVEGAGPHSTFAW